VIGDEFLDRTPNGARCVLLCVASQKGDGCKKCGIISFFECRLQKNLSEILPNTRFFSRNLQCCQPIAVIQKQ